VGGQQRCSGGGGPPDRAVPSRRPVVEIPGLPLLLLAIVVVLSGCGSSTVAGGRTTIPSLLPAGDTCGGSAAQVPSPDRVDLEVQHLDGAIRVLVAVCVDGRGPFPFVLDTGASTTLFDTHLLDYVRLGADAPPEILHQPGCATVQLHVAVPRWSLGSTPLTAQSVPVIRLPGFGLAGQPMGLLGSDVLGRFGAIRVDYVARILTLDGPEGPALPPGMSVAGNTADPGPSDLVGVGSGSPIPVDVRTSASGTSVVAQVSFGVRGPYPFDVASGALMSETTATLAAGLGLTGTGPVRSVTSFGCTTSAPMASSGHWSIGSIPLAPGPIVTALAATSSPGAEGLIGSDTLSSLGSFVLDYRSGTLYLGSGA